jgi:Ubiquitin carboxyl-terminal hydrolase
MKITLDELKKFLEYITSEKTHNLLNYKTHLGQSNVLEEEYQGRIMLSLGAVSKALPIAQINPKENSDVNAEMEKLSDLIGGFPAFEKCFEKLKIHMDDSSKIKLKERFDERVNVIQHLTTPFRVPFAESNNIKKYDDAVKELLTKVNNFNNECISDIINVIDESRRDLGEADEPKEGPTKDCLGLLEEAAALEREKNRRSLAIGAKFMVAGLPMLAYKLSCFLGRNIYYYTIDKGIHDCQDLLEIYKVYQKIKPIFKEDDDKKILKILKNTDFTKNEKETNSYQIAIAEVILSDTPPNEFIKALNAKLLGLEQRVWELVVSPFIDWNRQHRETLQHLMGLILVIEQTNKELSIITLDASNKYQTNDAWWKIFSAASSLVPGLLMKFAALNYLSYLFGSSSSIEAAIGKGIVNIIGYLKGDQTFDDISNTSPILSITHNSSNSEEALTGVLLTSGLAVETLSMVVATRIAYMNYASATDAYKKLIEEAENAATHVVDRCTKLIGDRLNYVDRSISFLDAGKLKVLENKLFLPLQKNGYLKQNYLNVRSVLQRRRAGKIEDSGLQNMGNTCYLNSCVQMLQYIGIKGKGDEEEKESYSGTLREAIDELYSQLLIRKLWGRYEQKDVLDAMSAFLEDLDFQVGFTMMEPSSGRFIDCQFLLLTFNTDGNIENAIGAEKLTSLNDYLIVTINRNEEESDKNKSVGEDTEGKLLDSDPGEDVTTEVPATESTKKGSKDKQPDSDHGEDVAAEAPVTESAEKGSKDKQPDSDHGEDVAAEVPVTELAALGENTKKKEKYSVSLTVELGIEVFDVTLKYKLKSIICHIGNTTESGHYVCYFLEQGGWYKADDTKVSPIFTIQEEDIEKNVYIALYEKVGTAEEVDEVGRVGNPLTG